MKYVPKFIKFIGRSSKYRAHYNRSTSIGCEQLEPRHLLALFGGFTSGDFEDPEPSDATISGVGTSQIEWGEANFGTPPSSLEFQTFSTFDVDQDEVFSLGSLHFFNGTIASNSGIDSIDFRVVADVETPDGVGSQDFDFNFRIINSPNTGDPVGDSDSVFLPSGFFSNIFTTPDGSQFTLELVGFGTVAGSGYSTINQFFVQESASASADVLGRFVRVPDLVATSFQFRVPADLTHADNGPIPVNRPYVITATVLNQGQGRAGTATAGIYLSTDNIIDPNTDFRIGTTTIPALNPGAQTTITVNMAPPATWPATLPPWHGVVTIGLVIDPDQVLPDGDFSNNLNRGFSIDSRPAQLYDAIAPITNPLVGVTYREALQWFIRNGFSPTLPFTGDGLSISLSTSIDVFSPFDGQYRSGIAYRQNAYLQYDVGAGTYRISLQGNPLFGEPNPATAALYGSGWFLYVLDWHTRF